MSALAYVGPPLHYAETLTVLLIEQRWQLDPARYRYPELGACMVAQIEWPRRVRDEERAELEWQWIGRDGPDAFAFHWFDVPIPAGELLRAAGLELAPLPPPDAP
jgi:hypothetical protein